MVKALATGDKCIELKKVCTRHSSEKLSLFIQNKMDTRLSSELGKVKAERKRRNTA